MIFYFRSRKMQGASSKDYDIILKQTGSEHIIDLSDAKQLKASLESAILSCEAQIQADQLVKMPGGN